MSYLSHFFPQIFLHNHCHIILSLHTPGLIFHSLTLSIFLNFCSHLLCSLDVHSLKLKGEINALILNPKSQLNRNLYINICLLLKSIGICANVHHLTLISLKIYFFNLHFIPNPKICLPLGTQLLFRRFD